MSLYHRSVRLALRAYKLTLSPLIGRQCRFAPSCSEYAAEALIGHGPWRGGLLAVRRVCRCNPWGGSGFDPVPPPPPASGKSKADFPESYNKTSIFCAEPVPTSAENGQAPARRSCETM